MRKIAYTEYFWISGILSGLTFFFWKDDMMKNLNVVDSKTVSSICAFVVFASVGILIAGFNSFVGRFILKEKEKEKVKEKKDGEPKAP